ncbi:MAG TPA: hypothetical protein VEB21_13555, partial [Terriglobales bacterium]|nr:hypothetical protein [Terriglobales bacterium]
MIPADRTYAPPVAWVAERLRRLPAAGVRRAVVLTGSERIAHAIRRHVCLELRAPELLAGVALRRPVALARELLLFDGDARLSGWESQRRLRLHSLFLSRALDRQLRYFDAAQLQSSLGYASSFAATIADLEASGLHPQTVLEAAATMEAEDPQAAARLHDVALVWQRADGDARERFSCAELLGDAAIALETHPALAASYGPVLAVLAESPTTVLLRFLRALPDRAIILQEARPLRREAQRWRQLLELSPVAEEPLSASPREIEVGRRYLFELPEVLTDPARPRSSGSDGSLAIEQYASVEDEVEAAVAWVGEQIAARTPLEQIALISPEPACYVGPLCDRLQRLAERLDLGGDAQASPQLLLHVAGGEPLAGKAAGLRLLGVLHAVAQSLEASAVIRVLPGLARGGAGGDGNLRLSPSRAARLVYEAGIVGGTPRDPRGVGEWVPRLTEQRDRMRAQAERAESLLASHPGDRLERRRLQIEAQRAREWLRQIEPILPAIAALQRLGEAVAAGADLPAIWRAFSEMCAEHLSLGAAKAEILALLRIRFTAVLADPLADGIRGRSAIHFLESLIACEPIATAPFGSPAIFLGTPAQAAGLPFAAVRLLGLAEGGVPKTPHDDPIVPDELRRRLESAAGDHRRDVVIPRIADQVLEDVQHVFRVIRCGAERVALSVPRQWTDRSERELSGIVLEMATALGRGSGANGDVPTAARLRAAYFDVDGQRSTAAAMPARRTPRSLL